MPLEHSITIGRRQVPFCPRCGKMAWPGRDRALDAIALRASRSFSRASRSRASSSTSVSILRTLASMESSWSLASDSRRRHFSDSRRAALRASAAAAALRSARDASSNCSASAEVNLAIALGVGSSGTGAGGGSGSSASAWATTGGRIGAGLGAGGADEGATATLGMGRLGAEARRWTATINASDPARPARIRTSGTSSAPIPDRGRLMCSGLPCPSSAQTWAHRGAGGLRFLRLPIPSFGRPARQA